jgi:hypothetical protein
MRGCITPLSMDRLRVRADPLSLRMQADNQLRTGTE